MMNLKENKQMAVIPVTINRLKVYNNLFMKAVYL